MAAKKSRAPKRRSNKPAEEAAEELAGAKKKRKPRAKVKKAKATKTSRSKAEQSNAPRYSVRRASSVPPALWQSRCKVAAWPGEPWVAGSSDEGLAQQLMLLAYWFADQLANSQISEERRGQLRQSVNRAASMLVADVPELVTWAVACAVRCHGASMVAAQESEQARIRPGGVLDALLEGHAEQAVEDTLSRVQSHSPKAAAWLRELERRGRPELRNALLACGRAPWQPEDPEHHEAMRRLLALVLFGTERGAARQ